MKEIKLFYLQKGNKGGLKEYYWYFMFGYLFLLFYYIFKIFDFSLAYLFKFIFEDCGLVMNGLIEEVVDLFLI